MVELWYLLVVALFAGFAVMEGWDFGVGAVLHRVARDDAERRAVLASIGPLWSWHEVWLIAAGGTLLAVFPAVLATALAGYYLAVFLLLWCLVLRGVALEVGGHLESPLWRQFWDAVMALSSALLAVLFGAAFGNLVRGVPLGADGLMFMPLFTDFRPRGQVGILDWYTGTAAIFSLVLLSAHGAAYLAMKTRGEVRLRADALARRLWPVAAALLAIVTVLTAQVRPDFFAAMLARTPGWLAAALIAVSLGAVFVGQYSGKDHLRFAGSCALIVGLVAGAAASSFPVMLHSTLDPASSLTAYAAASSRYALTRALVWWPVAMVLSVAYAVVIARRVRLKG